MSLIYILIYVDTIIITWNTPSEISRVLLLLAVKLSLKDLGDLSYSLGIEAHNTSAGLQLTQTRYTTNLLQLTKMANAKPVSTPLSSSQSVTINSGDVLTD